MLLVSCQPCTGAVRKRRKHIPHGTMPLHSRELHPAGQHPFRGTNVYMTKDRPIRKLWTIDSPRLHLPQAFSLARLHGMTSRHLSIAEEKVPNTLRRSEVKTHSAKQLSETALERLENTVIGGTGTFLSATTPKTI